MFSTAEEAKKAGWHSRRHPAPVERGETKREKKSRKRMEAEQRQAERNQRSPREQIKVLEARGVTSGREYDRLIEEQL